ncbi:LOW QUALITY PROTEIN: sensory neuron membrane protein 1-like [Drosophila mojavensis]|uniref:LOW QUALITY PROTEIN: sensory neuron membrane protein 1-like n=1 Tax=Drosophila mojavensis TaxID=7230 RepID=UPI001CD0D041|nr:LOW QUALITY PROTEIN: sensory neuron membrane protein 1-like [Drosophila mojavensis]
MYLKFMIVYIYYIYVTFAQSVNLKPGSETRQLWEKMPFPLSFKVYVFNVTNSANIEAGGKPQLQEVGPFVYDEWKDKYDIVDIEAENAVSFNMRNTFQFRPDLGLSGEELITMPHPLLQFLAIANLAQPAEVQAAVALGLDLIFQPQSAFITAKFKDLFYAGIDVNCGSDHAAVQAICQQFQAGAVPGAVALNATHYKFSLMGGASPLLGNHTNAGRFKVLRTSGSKQLTVGQILAYNEAEQLQVWQETNGSSCNRLRGTDGTIFAPLMQPQHGLWSYSAQLCRSLTPKAMGKTKYNQLPAQRYELSFGSPSVSERVILGLQAELFEREKRIYRKDFPVKSQSNLSLQTEPDLHCFCTDFPGDCPADGTMDLRRCSGTPLMASLPHFYQADPRLVEQVEGLSPTAAKHASTMIFEQLSGTVLTVYNRLQFSLKVMPVKDVPTMAQLRPLAMPLFWIEESLQLDEKITQLLHKKIFA